MDATPTIKSIAITKSGHFLSFLCFKFLRPFAKFSERFAPFLSQAPWKTCSVQSGSGPQTRGTAETATGGSRLQVVMATGIGLFCMVVLIVVRNSAQLNEAAAQSSTVMATVVQFRDFVSACVGFLIGYPAETADPPV